MRHSLIPPADLAALAAYAASHHRMEAHHARLRGDQPVANHHTSSAERRATEAQQHRRAQRVA